MKLKELIGELQRLEKLNPEAEAYFQLLVHNGKIRTVYFVDVVDIHGQMTIRIADEPEIGAIRRTFGE